MVSYLTNPLFYIFLFMLLELLTFWKRFRKLKHIPLACSIIILLIFSNPQLYMWVESKWIGEFDRTELENKHYRYGIVLGGYSYWDFKHNRPEFSEIADRLLDAIQLYHKGVIDKIVLASDASVISKEINPDVYGNPLEMRNYLKRFGVKEEDIIIEDRANNTRENATFTIELLGDSVFKQRPLLITSAMHMPRAYLAFQQIGLDVDTYATDIDSQFLSNGSITFLQPGIIPRWTALFHEIIGYQVYKIRYSTTSDES